MVERDGHVVPPGRFDAAIDGLSHQGYTLIPVPGASGAPADLAKHVGIGGIERQQTVVDVLGLGKLASMSSSASRSTSWRSNVW
jgi:hypothetical protein